MPLAWLRMARCWAGEVMVIGTLQKVPMLPA